MDFELDGLSGSLMNFCFFSKISKYSYTAEGSLIEQIFISYI